MTISLSEPVAPAAERIRALDVLRGATVAAMVLVNNPGDWNAVFPALWARDPGVLTLTSVIAPFFVWMAGFAMALSFGRRMQRGARRPQLLARAGTRAAALFAFGILINAVPQVIPLLNLEALSSLRVPGILQRIALGSLLAAPIILWLRPRWWAVWAVVLLAAHWLLVTLLPVPGYGAGWRADAGSVAYFVDHLLLGVHAKQQDPLGILGTLPAAATVLLGAIAALGVRAGRAVRQDVWLGMLGVVLLGAGLVLDRWIPINTNQYTAPGALFMSGLATLTFAGCAWALRGGGAQRWATPLHILSRNALVVFVASQVLASLVAAKGVARPDGSWVSLKGWVYERLFAVGGTTPLTSLAYALVWVGGFLLLAALLYRRGWFLTL